MTHTIDEWKGCYPSKWKGMIVPEAIAHPAKFSNLLIRRIYDHMIDEGWMQPGDKVVDPFGGVALGALEAMRHGLVWRGVELEARFADLGNQNIAFWNAKFSSLPKWNRDSVLINGDSRKLLTVLQAGHTAAISSPPYVDRNIAPGGIQGENAGQMRQNEGDTYGETPGQLGAMAEGDFGDAVASPPFLDGLARDNVTPGRRELAREKGISNSEKISPIDMEKVGGRNQEYGETKGQLGAMPAGDFLASISSPPFRQSEGGTPEPKPCGPIDDALYKRHAAGNGAASGYGATDGQLADMPEGDIMAAMKSPPYTGNVQVQKNSTGVNLEKMYETYKKSGGGASFESFCKTSVSSPPYLPQSDRRVPWGSTQGTSLQEEDERRGHRADHSFRGTYSDNPANLGNPTGADQTSFWAAARVIVDQVFLALAPGGHAVWVVKDFVKNKQRVPFCDQWRQLCEAAGFVTLHEHHAMLVHAVQHKLDGGVHRKESKSFFRRVAEGKGSPRVDYEVVFCMVKPQ